MMTAELVRAVGERERRLCNNNGVRIRVDSIAQDGHTLICTVFQSRKAPFLRSIDTIELVQYAENALYPLLAAGYTPMITAVDWAHGQNLRNSSQPIDRLDPIGLITSLREAGLPFPRLTMSSEESTQPIGDSFWRRALSLFAV